MHRRKRAVRLLGLAQRKAFRLRPPGVSDSPSGRSAAVLSGHLKRLQHLAEHDPDSQFWDLAQKAILRLLRYVEKKG